MMLRNASTLVLSFLIGGVLQFAEPAVAQDQAEGTQVTYQPPLRGAPHGRVGGATRGPSGDNPTIEVLAPDDVGLTTKPQPTFYYFTSGPVLSQLQLTITSDDATKPIAEVDLPRPAGGGVQAVRLADYNVSLKPQVEYTWTIALITNPSARSSDILASAIVKQTTMPPDLAAQLSGATPLRRAQVFAKSGVWYDALEELARDPQGRAARVALLDQVGLSDVARFEAAGGR